MGPEDPRRTPPTQPAREEARGLTRSGEATWRAGSRRCVPAWRTRGLIESPSDYARVPCVNVHGARDLPGRTHMPTPSSGRQTGCRAQNCHMHTAAAALRRSAGLGVPCTRVGWVSSAPPLRFPVPLGDKDGQDVYSGEAPDPQPPKRRPAGPRKLLQTTNSATLSCAPDLGRSRAISPLSHPIAINLSQAVPAHPRRLAPALIAISAARSIGAASVQRVCLCAAVGRRAARRAARVAPWCRHDAVAEDDILPPHRGQAALPMAIPACERLASDQRPRALGDIIMGRTTEGRSTKTIDERAACSVPNTE
ncbi:hypothetical protein HYPSUDRAFT_207183 [Hypholoma sublateritium FD-334 SS-4]|uniref:Uncharacterized protein n=1 Tax=Hypholoma sublateritium (strain FD-334 SS-4) TaxID=945553 RepID=A0A0D2NI76_HYPSF|nr:hypothetical protein HYPSUDRAFT_207183 [Hypholoma sublateritium FD-334 SS-4]